MDASRTPDLVPTIAVLGAVASGKTTVLNAEHVRHKETDRLHAMAVELSKMGADIRERPDGLEITGGKLHGAKVHGWHDHRIVMALTVAGLVAGETTDRYGGSGGCLLSGFLRADDGSWGESDGGMKGGATLKMD